LKAPAYVRLEIREYWILDINARRLYVFPEPGAEPYFSPVVLAKSDLIAPLAFPDFQESVEDLLSPPAEPNCESGNFKNFWTD
jgi:Uma2 family endonuclease